MNPSHPMSTTTKMINGKLAAANDSSFALDAALIAALREFQREKNLSQEQLARRLGLSATYVSRAFAGKFAGDVPDFERRVEALLNSESASGPGVASVELAQSGFMVEPMTKFLFTVSSTRDIGIAWSPAGRGKTCGVAVYTGKHPLAVSITALKSLSGWRSVRDAVLAALPVKRRAKNETWNAFLVRTFRASGRLLIIDNAHLLTESARQWLAYDWHEQTGCGLALVGNPEIVDQWKRNDQHHSRVGLALEVRPEASPSATARALLELVLPVAAHDKESLEIAARIVKARGAGRALRKHALLAKQLLESGAADTPAAALKQANSLLLSDVKLAA